MTTNEDVMPHLTHGSYLLRIWRPDTKSSWHVMVVDVAQPGRHQHFASLDALFAFLTAQTDVRLVVPEQMSVPSERDV